MTPEELIQKGRSVIEIEAAALTQLTHSVDHQFAVACDKILTCDGRVVVVGMGKSGHIGGKIAATLASTGSPAFFVHPGEASHGDLGMITATDLVVAISSSGETPEILTILPMIKRMGVPLIAMTGNRTATLARQADVCLHVAVTQEACPLNLAPTATTTAMLAMGDALSVAVLTARGFSAQDFARTHPGGSLGKRLLLYVSDIMHKDDDVPLVKQDAMLSDALLEMTGKSLGMTGVVDNDNRLVGIITDGDVRRILNNSENVYSSPAVTVMTKMPFTVAPDVLAAEMVKLMRDHALHGPHAINGVFVVDQQQRVLGAFNTHDLLRAGVM